MSKDIGLHLFCHVEGEIEGKPSRESQGLLGCEASGRIVLATTCRCRWIIGGDWSAINSVYPVDRSDLTASIDVSATGPFRIPLSGNAARDNRVAERTFIR